jgi:hypothetical protein
MRPAEPETQCVTRVTRGSGVKAPHSIIVDVEKNHSEEVQSAFLLSNFSGMFLIFGEFSVHE